LGPDRDHDGQPRRRAAEIYYREAGTTTQSTSIKLEPQ